MKSISTTQTKHKNVLVIILKQLNNTYNKVVYMIGTA